MAGLDTPLYLFVSCKDWHSASFDRLRQRSGERWVWVRDPAALDAAVIAMAPRYIFFLHWNWRVTEQTLLQHECVCFHMTDLPYGRGGSPLQNLIAAGHRETCLTALRMVEELDAGPIYLKKPMTLEGTAQDIYIRAGKLAEDMIAEIISCRPQPTAQQGAVVTFRRRLPAQSRLPDTGGLEGLYDHIRMLDASGYPPAFIEYGDFCVEFSNAKLDGDQLYAHVVLRPRGTPER
ncbi:hypothetical protein UYA_15055 [Ectopseudomonas alcaliphila JAB1]|nr:hypothetical protein [Pseudomonas alcaliphila]APU30969.1 hypothetical protein UYA_15055 [Pseudomonas alcaliphila JAB1]